MKIAIVAPSPVPFTIGGAEKLWWGMQNFINNNTIHHCELIKISVKENNFWDLIDSYYKFYNLDVSHFDLIVTTKYPAWMVKHKNHILYLQHHLRGLFDTYPFCNNPEDIPETLKKGLLIPILDIISKENPKEDTIKKLFDLLFILKNEKKNYESSLFKFPGPFIRKIIHFFDNYALSKDNIQRYYCISQNVRYRKDYFPCNAEVSPIYHPSLRNNFVCKQYQYLLTVSRLDGPKRIDVLINAMKYVPYDIKFKIAGTGPEEKNLKKLAAHDKRIEFLGYVTENDLIDLYANALVILYIPYDEDYGLITIEAMMSKKPVITAKDSGGSLEFVQNSNTGFVVDPDSEMIAEKINFFVTNLKEAEKMGNSAYLKTVDIRWDNLINTLLQIQKNDCQRKKKILVLSTYSSYPPRGGGQHRLYNIYSRLAKKFDVRICSIVDSNKSYENLLLVNGLHQICIPQSPEHAKLQWDEQNKLGKNLYDCCMIDLVEKSPQYIDEVKKQMTESDIIIFSHPYLFPLAKYINNHSKVIYEAHNVEYLLKKIYLNNYDWNTKLFSNEKKCCEYSNLIFTTSGEDKTNLLEIFNLDPKKIAVAPNGVDTQQIQYIFHNEKITQKKLCNLKNTHTILFVGSWHPPNLEALKFIIKDLLSKLNNTKLLLVGSIEGNYLSEVGKLPDNVLAFGVVSELEKYEIYKLADIAINPMFSGSGTNLKMLDYFSAGIPVVTTETGARGLTIEHNKEAIICSPETMLQSILQLMDDQQLQDKLRKNARVLVESTYSWDRIATEIERYIEQI